MKHEFDGDAYAEASAHQTSWGARVVGELVLQGSEEILDVGCGDGRVTEAPALRVPRGHVLGIDSSRSMIAAAIQRRTANLTFELQA